MTIKTRLFGKKIKGEALKNLVNAIGEKPSTILQTPSEKWFTKDVHGRVSFALKKDGIKVDLYIFRTDYFIRDNPTVADFMPHIELALFSDELGGHIYVKNYKKHFQGEIKYKDVGKTGIN